MVGVAVVLPPPVWAIYQGWQYNSHPNTGLPGAWLGAMPRYPGRAVLANAIQSA